MATTVAGNYRKYGNCIDNASGPAETPKPGPQNWGPGGQSGTKKAITDTRRSARVGGQGAGERAPDVGGELHVQAAPGVVGELLEQPDALLPFALADQ